MNRKIKFRAWGRYDEWQEDGEKRQWKMIDGDSLAFEEFLPLCDLLEDVEDEEYFMQFTGLHDKSGKEIYEGDIVRWDDGSNGKYWRMAEVFYDNDAAMFSFRLIRCINCGLQPGYIFGGSFRYRITNQLEIIGNIFENPELIHPNP